MLGNIEKKIWYKNKKLVIKSVGVASKVTFGTSKFFVRHIEKLLVIGTLVGAVALAVVAGLRDDRRNNINNQSVNVNINNLEYVDRQRERRRDSGWDSSGLNRMKQDVMDWLDEKENAINEWADKKVQECEESLSRLSQDVEYTRGQVGGNERLPTYEEVLSEIASSNNPSMYGIPSVL